MENDFRREGRRQYLHYFRFWFLAVGIMAVLCAALWVKRNYLSNVPRTNNEAPKERVYDYADVLTDGEEEKLREYIARMEKKMHIDIVLVTFSQSVEGSAAMEQYGLRSSSWEQNMQDIADDFWDENKYGYNKGFEGDGLLLLHNWYPGQNGEHLSTSGRVEQNFSESDIDRVLDAVDRYYDTDPYKAYRAYVKKSCDLLGGLSLPFSWATVIVLPLVVALIYAVSHASQKKAENTVALNAYVAGGKPVLRDKSDVFVTKRVTTRKIESSQSGGSGGGGRSGGGGHHHSSSGASHGGGSHRH